MCGGFVGKVLGMSPSSAPTPAAAPDAPKTSDKAVSDAVENQRKVEGEAQGREGTMLTGAQGVSIGMEKLQKKKLLGTKSPLGGS